MGVSFSTVQPRHGSTRERRNPHLYPKRNVSSTVMCNTNETENNHSTHSSRSRYDAVISLKKPPQTSEFIIIHGQAHRRLHPYPQHKLEIRVAWIHGRITSVYRSATSPLSIANRITGASQSRSHQQIWGLMHLRTRNNTCCMWSSGSRHNIAMSPIDLHHAQPSSPKQKKGSGCVRINDTVTQTNNTLNINILPQQLTESWRHLIAATTYFRHQYWVLPCRHHRYSHKEY